MMLLLLVARRGILALISSGKTGTTTTGGCGIGANGDAGAADGKVGYAAAPDLTNMVVGNLAAKDALAQLKEDAARQQAVGAGLVGAADAFELERLGDVFEPGLLLEFLHD